MDQYGEDGVDRTEYSDQMYDINIENIDLAIQPPNHPSETLEHHNSNNDGFRTPINEVLSTHVERNSAWTLAHPSYVADYTAGLFDDIPAQPNVASGITARTPPINSVNTQGTPMNASHLLTTTRTRTPIHAQHPLPPADSTCTISLREFLTTIKSATTTLAALDSSSVYSTICCLEKQLSAIKSETLLTSLNSTDLEFLKSKAAQAQLKEAEWQQKYDDANNEVIDMQEAVGSMKRNLQEKEATVMDLRQQLAGLVLANRQVDERVGFNNQTITRLTRRAEKAEEEIRKLKAQVHRPEATATSLRRSASPPRRPPHRRQQIRERESETPVLQTAALDRRITQQEEFPDPMAGLQEAPPRPYQLNHAAHDRVHTAGHHMEGRHPDRARLIMQQDAADNAEQDHLPPSPRHPGEGAYGDSTSGYYDSRYHHERSYRPGPGPGSRDERDSRAGVLYVNDRRYDQNFREHRTMHAYNDGDGYYTGRVDGGGRPGGSRGDYTDDHDGGRFERGGFQRGP